MMNPASRQRLAKPRKDPRNQQVDWKHLVWGAGLALFLLSGRVGQAGAAPLNKEEQARVNHAIDEGAAYLKRIQTARGSWPETKPRYLVGYTALPGLTLLECGVPADDPVLRRAAAVIRRAMPSIDGTYEIALSILFLDRLGDPKDRELIQTLAARLIGGQSATGGWSYKCPLVGKKMQQELFTALRGGEPPARLKLLPVFKNAERLPAREIKGTKASVPPTTTDNSNTQFAVLALWVAQRHEVPARPTMNLFVRRFEGSQNTDGSWSYRYLRGEGEPAMTCVGLLGLAVGHGIAQEPNAKPDGKPIADMRILNGLTSLRDSVGEPTGNWRFQPMENLYYLWSLERVGVLYGLPAIGEKDWYRWGAEILVANQQRQGGWTNGGYHGSSPIIDTCLALLFLKRANFTADLTARLPFKAEELNKSITRVPRKSLSPGISRNPEKKP